MHHLQIALYRAYADLKTEASRSFIGFAWWIFEPVLYMLAFYVVFELGLRRGEENFLAFLLIGLILWKWFASTITSSSGIINANRGLLNQVYLPKWIFPLTVVFGNTSKLLISCSVLMLFLLVYGIEPGIAWFGFVPILLVQFVLILGCSMLSASLTPFFPELKLIIDNVILALMFLSGVFFNLDNMEPGVREILMWNPVAILIRDARWVLLDKQLPVDHGLLYVLIVSVICILSALWILVRFDKLYPKVLTS